MTDNDHSDSIVIVYPAFWNGNIDPEAHCTILYLGNISDASFSREDIENALSGMDLVAPGQINVVGTEMFGENKDYPVWLLEPTALLNLTRKLIEDGLSTIGAENASEFKDYRPHVTVNQLDFDLPNDYVELGVPTLWWGDER